MVFKLRFKDIEGDEIGSDEGWDIDLDAGTVFIVDPRNPDLYGQNAEALTPGALILAMARVADDITVEEVFVEGEGK